MIISAKSLSNWDLKINEVFYFLIYLDFSVWQATTYFSLTVTAVPFLPLFSAYAPQIWNFRSKPGTNSVYTFKPYTLTLYIRTYLYLFVHLYVCVDRLCLCKRYPFFMFARYIVNDSRWLLCQLPLYIFILSTRLTDQQFPVGFHNIFTTDSILCAKLLLFGC